MLVFYCCITNYHELCGLKEHIFILIVSLVQESRYNYTGSRTQSFRGSNQYVGCTVFSSGGLTEGVGRGGESASQFSCWQNSFACVCRAKGPASC